MWRRKTTEVPYRKRSCGVFRRCCFLFHRYEAITWTPDLATGLKWETGRLQAVPEATGTKRSGDGPFLVSTTESMEATKKSVTETRIGSSSSMKARMSNEIL